MMTVINRPCRGVFSMALVTLLMISALPRGALGEIRGETMNPEEKTNIQYIDITSIFSKEDFLRLRDIAFLLQQEEPAVCELLLNNGSLRHQTPFYRLQASYLGPAPSYANKSDFMTLEIPVKAPATSPVCFPFYVDQVFTLPDDSENYYRHSRSQSAKLPGMASNRMYLYPYDKTISPEQIKVAFTKRLRTLKATLAADPVSTQALFRLGETSYYSDGQAIYVVLSNAFNSSGFVAPADHIFGNLISLTDAPFTPPESNASFFDPEKLPLNKERQFHRLSVAEFHQFIEPGRQYFSTTINVAVQCPDLNFWQEGVYDRLEECGEVLFPAKSAPAALASENTGK